MINETKFNCYEPDSSEWTWNNFYNKTYRTLDYWKNLGKERTKGKYKQATYIYKNLGEIEIGGDVIFNFKKGHGKTFRELLANEYNEKVYARMHYSVLNFSFMPVTGGLNLNKANGQYCDRLDRFIFHLDKLIQTKNSDNPLLGIRGTNKHTIPKLKDYLNDFDSIEEYCQVYYLLDSKKTDLVERLKNSGEEYVNTGATAENCKQYLNLAFEFWAYRTKIFKEDYGMDVYCLDDGIDIEKVDNIVD